MQQITDWLKKLGMSEYVQRFVENRITTCAIIDSIALADVQAQLGAVPPDSMLHEPREGCAFSKHYPVVPCNLVRHGRLAEASAGGAEASRIVVFERVVHGRRAVQPLRLARVRIAMVVQSL
jgi:hypothetical protein